MKRILAPALVLLACTSALRAQATELVFVIDGSVSIVPPNFALQLEGIARAVENPLIMPHNGSVAVAVVQFSHTAQVEVPLTTLVSQAVADNVAATIRAIVQLNGSTNMTAGIDTAALILAGGNPAAQQVMCLSSDGFPNNPPNAVMAADNAIAGGVERIDTFGVVPADMAFLQSLVRNGGFFSVASFLEFRDAIGEKVAALLASLCPPVGSRKPGSALIFPVHRSGPQWFTILTVVNTNPNPATPTSFGGSTNVHIEYVNTTPSQIDPLCPTSCVVFDRIEHLTPNDVRSVLATCDNAFGGAGQEGYVVVTAQDPARFNVPWAFNWLLGSELVISASGVSYMLTPLALCSPLVPGAATDQNGNGYPDFDDIEYQALPDVLYVDSFIALLGSQLTLINFTGTSSDRNTIDLSVYNDDERPLSARVRFCCWFDRPLQLVSPLFSATFLAGVPNDPDELDVDCAGGTLETGWFSIDSVNVRTRWGTPVSDDGAIYGSITAGLATGIDGGKLVWNSLATQTNGAFSRL